MQKHQQKSYDVADAIHDSFVDGIFRREVACFAADGIGVIAMFTEGCNGHVEFDFFRIWEAMKATPRMPQKVWMYHTHPPTCLHMSPTDENAIKGWATALGMPVQMIIVSGKGAMRYTCLPRNIVVEMGLRDGMPSEPFLMAAMRGMSVANHNFTQEDLERVASGLDAAIPPWVWDVKLRTETGVDAYEAPS